MSEVVTVKLSPNHSNIMYVERRRTDLETDFSESLRTLKEKQKDTVRVVVYCRTLMICADLFSRFSEMGKSQYYPPSAPELSENHLFGMFHASTPQHSPPFMIRNNKGTPPLVKQSFVNDGVNSR